jgi:hypothetical protein
VVGNEKKVGCFRKERKVARWWCRFGLWLLGMAALAPDAKAQAALRLRSGDRVRLAEAARVAAEVRAEVWPGWEATEMPVLLVTDSIEFLVGHTGPAAGFATAARPEPLQPDVRSRPRRFSPTLLATFPAVDGVPTIVIGSAEETGKASTPWVLTLLHEHFHQWQFSQPGYFAGVARLDLAGGDSTGRWMLDYPFPYDALPVRQASRRLATALALAVADSGATRAGALADAGRALSALRRSVRPADYRYLEFQLWQEGVARYVEYAVASAASRRPAPAAEFRGLPDYQPYQAASRQARVALLGELEALDLGRDRRTAFYPIGAAIALILEETEPAWKRAYIERPFVLGELLTPDTR